MSSEQHHLLSAPVFRRGTNPRPAVWASGAKSPLFALAGGITLGLVIAPEAATCLHVRPSTLRLPALFSSPAPHFTHFSRPGVCPD